MGNLSFTALAESRRETDRCREGEDCREDDAEYDIELGNETVEMSENFWIAKKSDEAVEDERKFLDCEEEQ